MSSSTESLLSLSRLIKSIGGISKKIIDDSLKIMKQLQDEDSEYVDDVIETLENRGVAIPKEDGTTTSLERMEILVLLQKASLKWTLDAEQVGREIKQFIIENAKHGTFKVNLDTEECPFLSEVWNGDLYNKTGQAGLRALLDELEIQLSEITDENLIEMTVADYLSSHGSTTESDIPRED